MGQLLEIIALDTKDAVAAQAGGADRLELVADIAADGLTPSVATLRSVLAAVDIPVRVMLRDQAGFAPADLDRLRRDAVALREAGASEFVLGFLTADGTLDSGACKALLTELDGCRWTCHRAVDNAGDIARAWSDAAELGCDTILSAGSADGIDAGWDLLIRAAAWEPFHAATHLPANARLSAPAREISARTAAPVSLLVGGGLRLAHIPPLRDAGVRAFHTGSAVRTGGWQGSVDPAAVRQWAGAAHRTGLPDQAQGTAE
ncbi:copper homeostasis protein CutC [Nocardia sp. NPDC052566]|uniref:copper homeostasis protein CutC n=1 Tax=Nocardia sp. NPDC052566 TaxID=3364330 RepID=UPI0037CCC05A